VVRLSRINQQWADGRADHGTHWFEVLDALIEVLAEESSR
jgi:hypothetical protein